MRARAALLAVVGAACLAGGCDRGEAPAKRPPAPAPAQGGALPLPAPGETRVERRGARYDVAASEAAAEDALTELSMRAGFRIERGSGPRVLARRTVWLRDVSLERAVAAILVGVPHSVHHEFADGDLDPARPFEGRAVALARVTVGDPPPAGAAGMRGERRGRADRAGRVAREPGAARGRTAERKEERASDGRAELIGPDPLRRGGEHQGVELG